MSWALALGLARGLHMAASYSLFGTLLLCASCRLALPLTAPVSRLAWGSLLAMLAMGSLWFVLQGIDMAGAQNIGELTAALPVVTLYTRFGHLLLLRGLLSVAAIFCFHTEHLKKAAFLAGLAVLLQAGLGHGGAMSGPVGSVLLISLVVHLASSSAWLGSLPALLLLLARLPPEQAARLAQRYSPFGMACVVALVGSAIVQFVFLIGSPANLLNSSYGRVALVKILILTGLVLLAAINRYRLAPALSDGNTAILLSIGFEIVLGLSALLAAGLLLNLEPPAMAAMP